MKRLAGMTRGGSGSPNLYAKFRAQLHPGRVMKKARDWSKGFLGMVGAFTRRKARDLIRYRKSVSAPGEPPSAHLTLSGKRHSELREGIFFAVEGVGNVVIGPWKVEYVRRNTEKGAPELLEYGGETRRKLRSGKLTRQMHYRPRPFMHPAFDEGLADAKRKSAVRGHGIPGVKIV